MDQSIQYGQMDFNLPHDVVKLPSKGIYYKPRKESLKVGYLTAADENLLSSSNTSADGLIMGLLKNKIYEPGFDVNQMISCDVNALLIFLRNTAFGSEYTLNVIDPATNKPFETTILLDELSYINPLQEPDQEGLFTFTLPKSRKNVKCKILSMREINEIDKIVENYPKGMVAPVVTKRLEKQIVELDGVRDKGEIAQFINQMPISDSKQLKKLLLDCEPGLDLKREIIAPSGEKVTANVVFGVEFFRPFFQL